MIYLDNNATTPLAPEVKTCIFDHINFYANPSSLHALGRKNRQLLDNARQQVAFLLECKPQEIIFTSGGTESNNLAILGSLPNSPGTKNHIITTQVEHPSVLETMKKCESRGWKVTYLPVNKDGELCLSSFTESISPKTFLVSIMYANNETGVIFPVEKIAKIAKEYNALIHVDATQIVGRSAFSASNFDLLTLSGHKFHSLKGVGALYVKTGVRIVPIIHGGKQERNIRSGTENFHNIIAMGQASHLAKTLFLAKISNVKEMRDNLQNFILHNIPNSTINGINSSRLINTMNVSFNGVLGEILVRELSKHKIYISHGSACSSGGRDPSHVLKAMNLDWGLILNAVRFSFSIYNTMQEVELIKKILPQVICKLREIPT
ncbi:cysteine desulfurase family protein [Candidatus Uabimicrobium sp. HlEnr_7]|uniref:cysteine desulfurase family protein n=1 Tax=Candidatus Uabimicrobium helgolandensis TaxID=3095367 RepID=UPI0035591161